MGYVNGIYKRPINNRMRIAWIGCTTLLALGKEMARLHKSAVLLGFFGDDLDPAEITRRLGCAPTVGVRRGGSWLTSRGAVKIAKTGSWRLIAPDSEPADLDGQINHLLEYLPDDLSVWRSLSGQYRGTVFCGLFLADGNEGVTLRPENLVKIGERGLLMDFDIYARESLADS